MSHRVPRSAPYFALHCLASVLCAPFSAQGAVLKPYLTTEQETIRLSDVFEDVTKYGDIVVAPAPPPGHQQSFSTHWLQTLAQQYQVSWKPQLEHPTFTVTRKGVPIETSTLEEHIQNWVRNHLNIRDISVALDPLPMRMSVASLDKVHFKVENFHQTNSDCFYLTLIIHDHTLPPQKINVKGRLIRALSIPVLARDIRPGEIILEKDITLKEIRSDQIPAHALRNTEQVVMHEANLRPLKAGQYLQPQDLKVALAIHAGEIVTMVLKTNRITVTLRGKALDNGKFGDSVRVMNTDSKKVITGIAEKSSVVRVSLPGAVV